MYQDTIHIRRGLNISLQGEAERVLRPTPKSRFYGLNPADYPGIDLRLMVHAGDRVEAGDMVFCSKACPEMKVCAPVSGVIVEIKRGECRHLDAVVIESDEEISFKRYPTVQRGYDLEADVIKARMLESGCCPLIMQRPFGVIANPEVAPKAIYVSGFDSAPLAPDYGFSLRGEERYLRCGIEALCAMTGLKMNLFIPSRHPAPQMADLRGTIITHTVSGPHPAGNVGIQIHHLRPVQKGEVVWCVSPNSLVIIGKLFLEGCFDTRRMVAITGSEVAAPCYYETFAGIHFYSLLRALVKEDVRTRFIDGNPLSGEQVSLNDFLSLRSTQITVLPEGNESEFLGWAMPGFKKFSASRLFPSFLFPRRRWRLNTNTHGEERPFVMSGEYDKVLPMNIYPVYLLKAILAGDIERMEQLGIYEVVPEDFALCEFVCTSKINVQAIIRDGIALMRKEGLA